MRDESQLEEVFTYHSPDESDVAKYKEIRETAKGFAKVLFANCPASADRTDALRKLREVVMTANASIALKGIVSLSLMFLFTAPVQASCVSANNLCNAQAAATALIEDYNCDAILASERTACVQEKVDVLSGCDPEAPAKCIVAAGDAESACMDKLLWPDGPFRKCNTSMNTTQRNRDQACLATWKKCRGK